MDHDNNDFSVNDIDLFNDSQLNLATSHVSGYILEKNLDCHICQPNVFSSSVDNEHLFNLKSF